MKDRLDRIEAVVKMIANKVQHIKDFEITLKLLNEHKEKEPLMVYCSKCGTQKDKGKLCCGYCGTDLSRLQSPQSKVFEG